MEVTPEAGPSSPPATNGDLPPAGPAAGTDEAAPGGGDTEMEDPDALPEGASEVVYVNNLNEKIKVDIMKQTLRNLFKQYGKVLGVTAHGSIRMRGQAFVTLADKELAAKAVKEVKGFPLYGKPMQLSFARTASDALVKSKLPEDFEKHKAERAVRKKISRRNNPLRQKFLAQKEAAKKAQEAALASGITVPSIAAARRIVQMPQEYLPPNKILFVQNLPDDATKEMVEELFRPYPNLSEVRTIPGRKNIAFVEFVDEGSSGVAKDALHNTKIGEGESALKLKVTFAKLG